METKKIIEQLNKLQAGLFIRTVQGVEPADPVTLSKNLLQIRGLLVPLVDKVADAERSYKHRKAAEVDKLLKEGMKPSPAMDKAKLNVDLIDLEIDADRLRNYMKHTDGLCTSIQSVLRVQSAQEKNQY